MNRVLALVGLLGLVPVSLDAACGGSFDGFLDGVRREALDRGLPPEAVTRFLSGARQDQGVLRADRRQGIFQRPFIDFSRRLISRDRLARGRQTAQKYDAVFAQIEREYGIGRGVLLAFWAFETDFGAVQGDYNTRDALLTLAHDCRRPEIFRPQVFAAIELTALDEFDPARTTGAWAGEIGMVQMLPRDILEYGRDGDGDGRVTLKTSAPDALLSAAAMLTGLGWRAGEPWLQEVRVPPNLDWRTTGLDTVMPAADWARLGVRPREGALADLPASLILPQGHKGPAFLAYPNFRVYFEWNQSFTYVLTAAYFATRLEGAPVYDAGDPDTGLDSDGMMSLQRKLAARGHDVGGIDGILGAGTRRAVRAEQERLGLPADGWPTPDLLRRL